MAGARRSKSRPEAKRPPAADEPPTPDSAARGWERFHVPLLLAASALVFANALGTGFVYDDHVEVLNQPVIQYWHFFDLFDDGWGRQVRTLTLMLDYALFGESAFGYHVHNLLWHGVAVWLVYATTRRLSGRANLAFAAALLFAVHPIHVEAVTNIANRKEQLCLTFCLASFLAYVRFLDTNPKHWGWLAASAGAGLLALFSKQVAAVLPLSMFLYECLYLPPERRFAARYPALVAGAGVAVALAGFALFEVGSYLSEFGTRTLDGYEVHGYTGEATVSAFVLTAARAFWSYVGLMTWPAGLCPDHVVALSASLFEPAALAAWLGIAGLLVGALLARRTAPLATFGVLWLLVHYLPVSNLIPSAYVLADRYMYVPSAGFCMATAAAGGWLYDRLSRQDARTAFAVCAGLLGVAAVGLGATTVAYNRHWQDDERLWSFTLGCCPLSQRAHAGLGTIRQQSGDHEEAARLFSRALELEPDSKNLPFFLANSLTALGRNAEATRYFAIAVERQPDFAEAHYNRGIACFAIGDTRCALSSYERAIALRPDFADAYVNRGRTYLRLGRTDSAFADYLRAVELEPANAIAHYNLGAIHRSRGQRSEAEQSFSTAARLGLDEARQALQKL